MRLVFAGTPQLAVPALEALHASAHEVVAVVTRPDAPTGRGRRLEPSPVAAWASQLGLEVLKPSSPDEPGFLRRLGELRPQCCPVVAYGGMIPSAALTVPDHGWVHLHFSVLPAWRGAAPVQHALMAGDEVTGATVFRIVEELDAGPTFGVLTERVRPDDTAGEVLHRLARNGADLLLDVLDRVERGEIEARPQPPDGVTYAPKVTVDDARIDWTRPATAIDRQIRGCTPTPGAWTLLGDLRLKVGPVRVTDDPTDRAADTLAGLGAGRLAVAKHTVHVGTGSVPVLLGDVQPRGKPSMPAADWARGAHLGEEPRFG